VARREEAIAELQKAVSVSRGLPSMLTGLGHAYAVSGRRAEAAARSTAVARRSAPPAVSAKVSTIARFPSTILPAWVRGIDHR